MINIIVLFSKSEDARAIKNLLVKTGFNVVGVVTSGAQAIALADELNDGIVVCGYKFPDMMYNELRQDLPEYFDMLLLAGRSNWVECRDNGLVCVEMPLRTADFVDTLNMMVRTMERKKKAKRSGPKIRSQKDAQTIASAKTLLMERNNMSEEEAHRYIQKTSMDSGTNMAETARMILELM